MYSMYQYILMFVCMGIRTDVCVHSMYACIVCNAKELFISCMLDITYCTKKQRWEMNVRGMYLYNLFPFAFFLHFTYWLMLCTCSFNIYSCFQTDRYIGKNLNIRKFYPKPLTITLVRINLGQLLWLKKCFRQKNLSNKLALFCFNYCHLWKNHHNIVFLRKTPIFFTENCRKSQIIVIITSTPVLLSPANWMIAWKTSHCQLQSELG
jgi:hypothetical protein